MRLIDADTLYFYMTDSIEQQKAEDARDEAPTVDAVQVVRCKDCIHYYADPWGYGNCVFKGGVSRRTKESDFCSWGERRKDGQD